MAYHQLVENQRAFWRSGATACVNKRKTILNTYKKLLLDNEEQLNGAIFQDLHRVSDEVSHLVREIDHILDNLDDWIAHKKIEDKTPFVSDDDNAYLVPESLGVVLVISPWNFPLVCSGPSIAALAAGNTVIVKPSELAPTFSAVFAKLINESFDENLFKVVEGAIPETTALLNERFDYIMYTGNPTVAKIIMAAASKHLTPITLELGGKNPVLVESDADIDDAAKKIVFAKSYNCGQICISADYVLTTAEIRPKLVEAIRKVYSSMLPLKSNAQFARIVHERHFDRLSNLLNNTNGEIIYMTDEVAERSEKFLPPALILIEKDDAFMNEEVFGPLLPILVSPSFEDSVKYIKEHEKPLAAYIFTKDRCKARRFIAFTSSGGLCVNDVMSHAFIHKAPFGGVGNSGMGRINGKYGFDTFTHEKTVLVRGGINIL